MARAVELALSGWGRSVIHRSLTYRPERWREVREIIASEDADSLAVRGAGLSYGDAALNDRQGVMLSSRLCRLLHFDEVTGVVECEAGVTFDDLLRTFVPRGYFPPVTPGTKFVTVGGAVAADVHGKNHHQVGSFAAHVMEITLLCADGRLVKCSPVEKRDIFEATVGGMGLTGVILAVRFRMKRIESSYLLVDFHRASGLSDVLARFEQDDHRYEYSVAWVDCLARGSKLGRSILMRANSARPDQLPIALGGRGLETHNDPKFSVPAGMPGWMLRKGLARSFNSVYFHRHRDSTGVPVHYDPFFYPLDGVADWNRLYGRRGFWQYQAAFDSAVGSQAMGELIEALRRSPHACMLAVLKAFGKGSGGVLSFPRPGFTLSLDIPNQDGSRRFLGQLDEIVCEYAGRVYLAKDACLTSESFRKMYPDASSFERIKATLDPEGRFDSSLARRVGLT